jgi:hypothetical protein
LSHWEKSINKKASKNMALRGMFYFKRKKAGGNWIICVIGSFVLCNSQKTKRLGGAERVAHMRQRCEMHTGSWSGNLKESGHLKPTRIFGKVLLKLIFKKEDARRGMH